MWASATQVLPRLQREARLLVIPERGNHVVQLFERDEAPPVSQLVLINGHRELIDFGALGIIGVSELPTFEATGPRVCRRLPPIDEPSRFLFRYRGLLLNNLFHYHTPECRWHWRLALGNCHRPTYASCAISDGFPVEQAIVQT